MQTQTTNKVRLTWINPFELGSPNEAYLPEGKTVTEIVEYLTKVSDGLPTDFLAPHRGMVTINGEEVPQAIWPLLRPKASVCTMCFHYRVQGGGEEGGGTGKMVLTLVLAVAMIATQTWIIGGGLAAGGLFTAGSVSAKILAGAISIAGALAIGALSSPPSASNTEQRQDDSSTGEPGRSDIQGNSLAPNTTLTTVIGRRKVYPPFLTTPIIERIGQDEFVYAVAGLAGAHRFKEIRLGQSRVDLDMAVSGSDNLLVSTDDVSVLEIQLREGKSDDPLIDVHQRQAYTKIHNQSFQTHVVDPDDQSAVLNGVNSWPQWFSLATRSSPEEVWIHLNVAQLIVNNQLTWELEIPFRMRIRKRGEIAWRNLPEFHFTGKTQTGWNTQIRLMFGAYASQTRPSSNVVQDTLAITQAFVNMPAQTQSPSPDAFVVDPYFVSAGGEDYLDKTTIQSTNVLYTSMDDTGITFWLDTAEWDPGIYDIQIKQGSTFRTANWDRTAYTYSGLIYDFFADYNTALPVTREGLSDSVVVVRDVSVWNEHPLANQDMTLIAIKSKNRSVEEVQIVAEGYARIPVGFVDPTSSDIFKSSTAPNTSKNLIGDHVSGERSLIRCSVVLPLLNEETELTTEGFLLDMIGPLFGVVVYMQNGCLWIDLWDIPSQTKSAQACIELAQLDLDDELHDFAFVINHDDTSVDLWFDGILVGSGITSPRKTTISEYLEALTPIAAEATLSCSFEKQVYAVNEDSELFEGLSGPQVVFDFINGVYKASQFENSNSAGTYTIRYLTTGGATTLSGTFSQWPDVSGASDCDYYSLLAESDRDWSWDWSAERYTRNPAAWFVDVLSSKNNKDPLPATMRDDASLYTWYRHCSSNNYTIDMVVKGMALSEILRIIAATGYARPYQSELWGVIRDYDRSKEMPVQQFTPRNSKNLTWSKAFPRLPAGMRINYDDALNDWEPNQVQIWRPNNAGSQSRIEQITYEGMTDEAKVATRGWFDFNQTELRSTFYDLTVPLEWLRCRRGSLVNVSHDFIANHVFQARIQGLEFNSDGFLSVIEIDTDVSIINREYLQDVAALQNVTELAEVGIKMGVMIRKTDGTFLNVELLNPEEIEDSLELKIPISPTMAAEIDLGNLVVVGPMETTNMRMLVLDIRPNSDLEADLVLVDEAPTLWDDYHQNYI